MNKRIIIASLGLLGLIACDHADIECYPDGHVKSIHIRIESNPGLDGLDKEQINNLAKNLCGQSFQISGDK